MILPLYRSDIIPRNHRDNWLLAHLLFFRYNEYNKGRLVDHRSLLMVLLEKFLHYLLKFRKVRLLFQQRIIIGCSLSKKDTLDYR